MVEIIQTLLVCIAACFIASALLTACNNVLNVWKAIRFDEHKKAVEVAYMDSYVERTEDERADDNGRVEH